MIDELRSLDQKRSKENVNSMENEKKVRYTLMFGNFFFIDDVHKYCFSIMTLIFFETRRCISKPERIFQRF